MTPHIDIYFRCLVTAMIFCLPAAAQPQSSGIAEIVHAETPELIALYQQLHQHPELSEQEKETSRVLADELRALGFDVTERVGGYGVVGMMKNGGGPVVLVRTDMDALPITELTEVPYISNVPGVMHACGHDVHMTVWKGTASVVSKLRDQWRGTVVFVAQPAEENGVGAKSMLADGLFTRFPRPDYALALHVSSVLPAGTVGYHAGMFLASIDNLTITVKGRGGHGAAPQQTIDPIVLTSKIVLSLQSIISREIAPTEPAVISVGSIHGGSRSNIIPSEVEISLTVRTFEDHIREHLLRAIKRVADGEAHAAGLTPEEYPHIKHEGESFPSMYNDPKLTEQMAAVFRQTLGEQHVRELSRELVGEDFARYGREQPPIPTMIYSLGTVHPDHVTAAAAGQMTLPPLHGSLYVPVPDPSIPTGVKTMSAAVLSLLQQKLEDH
ncbi:M20 metallopeptidase family protein [Parapedobacter indicus]|uniref:Hippurate hydrolase n=1 Tax=Parapedobacter indicus TaxID=1477437 RepID=A0A1I3KEA3_9SPHI|nr:amidohydrolase [Parapedobacter indicus]PPL01791.1 hippurate hydrolase [Parapedobacter indicus]SFI70618.1 hippurate hydrolase [Parapedobacter indicus]